MSGLSAEELVLYMHRNMSGEEFLKYCINIEKLNRQLQATNRDMERELLRLQICGHTTWLMSGVSER